MKINKQRPDPLLLLRITYDDQENEKLDEWTTAWTDMAGRQFRTDYSDGELSEILTYNTKGQLEQRYQGPPSGTGSGPGTRITFYQYNGRGELEYVALDVNQNGEIDFAGEDRITRSVTDVVTAHGTTVRRRTEYDWPLPGDNPRMIRRNEVAVSGLQKWETVHGLTTSVETEYQLTDGERTGDWTVTTIRPDLSRRVEHFQTGRLAQVEELDGTSSTLTSVTYLYDEHGRLEFETDARNGLTSYSYYDSDRVESVTQPPPSPGASAPQTHYQYDDRRNADGVRPLFVDFGVVWKVKRGSVWGWQGSCEFNIPGRCTTSLIVGTIGRICLRAWERLRLF